MSTSTLFRNAGPLRENVRPAVRRWALVSAVLGPLALTVAWIVAGTRQPAVYSPVHQSMSALAVYSAPDRWIMTSGIYVVGVCQIVTALGLPGLRPGPRWFLAVGGVAGLGVAYFPQPEHGPTGASPHIIFATISIVCLAVWPALIGSRALFRATALRASTVGAVTAVFAALLLWVYFAGHGVGGLGVAERVDTGVTNAWPLVVVVVLLRLRTANA